MGCPLAVFRPWRLCLRTWEHRMVLAGQLYSLAFYHTDWLVHPRAERDGRRWQELFKGGEKEWWSEWGSGTQVWSSQVPQDLQVTGRGGQERVVVLRMDLVPWEKGEGTWHWGGSRCVKKVLEWWITSAMAHIAWLHRYLQGLMRHLQSHVQSQSVAVVRKKSGACVGGDCSFIPGCSDQK